MKKAGWLVSLVLCWGLYACNVRADDFFGTPKAAAVLNAPAVAVTAAENATNVIQPAVETLYDFHHGNWSVGTSAALYTLSSHSFPLASLRAGYAAPEKVYGEIQLDLPGITNRFIAPHVPAQASSGVLGNVWSVLGKYGHVGGFLGYDVDQTSTGSNHAGGMIVGVALGGRLTF